MVHRSSLRTGLAIQKGKNKYKDIKFLRHN